MAKLGNRSQVHVGLAHVPVESALHMVWILQLLNRGGLDVSSIPICSYLGNLLAAHRILWHDRGICCHRAKMVGCSVMRSHGFPRS
jgi:hypothetical protein